MNQFLVFIVLSVLGSQTFGSPNSDRVKESTPLSHSDHYDADGKHNPDFDHDAFLGEETAKQFSGLTPQQSKEKLRSLLDKIDEDGDGLVNTKELTIWIERQQKQFVYKDADRHWKNHDVNNDTIVTWYEYNITTYSGMPLEVLVQMPENEAMNFNKRVRRDKARWVAADVNKDENLDYEEFVSFVHAEEREHMHDVYVSEALEDIDTDGDGKLSLEEYINDLYKRPADGEQEEPDWLKTERESFGTYRDHNGDGYMDRNEVKEWLIPSGYNAAEAEARHLIYESDKNKDKMLSKEEIMDNWSHFVPSRAMMAEREEL